MKTTALAVLIGLTIPCAALAWLRGHETVSACGSGFEFVFVDRDGDLTTFGSGDGDDELQELADRERGNALLFDWDGDTYVVRDPEVIAQARHMLAPVLELSRQQREIASNQVRIAREQVALSVRQARIGARTQAIASIATSAARPQATFAGWDANAARLRWAERSREVAERVREFGMQAREFGAESRKLGEQQSQLGDLQAELGEKHERVAAEAQDSMESLARISIDSGAAQIRED